MAFRKGVDFVQLERDELVEYRPVVVYVTAPVRRKDFSSQTSCHKHFSHVSSFPDGVLKRDANPYNLCLVEASSDVDQFKVQLSAAFGEYTKAAHKVVVLNVHGSPDGMILKENSNGCPQVQMDGRSFAEIVSQYTDDHNLHVFTFFAYGHVFADQLYSHVRQECPSNVSKLMAVSYFTSKSKPAAWDVVCTAGNGNVEVTREMRDFIKNTIRTNNPYKTLEEKIKP